ncbi:retinol dehydrogenase 14 [Cladorrhinum samala]|uniref:Retinol dehydrogenase 14 n=1 Tax=Cladorrhinum samala TaxID=585594 RepID=A0AAV9HPX5_9PEZI|nr:retinol dehydrogenase 14 [Cladorrhinum samala]
MAKQQKQQLEFPIATQLGKGLRLFFYSQLFVTPPYPKSSFAGKTVIVTGANAGLGLEASRHFYRLGAAKLILAVRTVSKGQAAKEDIVQSVKTRNDPDSIEVWPVDASSTESTLAFSGRVKSTLDRLDVLVLNAGVQNETFQLSEGYEQTVQVNVLNTLLLGLDLLPKLNETKSRFPDSSPHLNFISSDGHRLTTFPEINAPSVYDKLNEKESYSIHPVYQASKLIGVLFVRELVARLRAASKESAPGVIINLVNPGLCASTLGLKENKPPLLVRVVRGILDRSLEHGSRTYVLAASAPAASHGEFQSDGKNQDVEAWIYSEVGQRAQRKVWEQTVPILEKRKPGLLRDIGL